MKFPVSLLSLCTVLSFAAPLVADVEGAPRDAFLLERVKVITDDGVIGLPPGTPVTIVSGKNGKLTVRAGKHQFDVTSEQLTDDLVVIGRMALDESAAAKEKVSAVAVTDKEEAQNQLSALEEKADKLLKEMTAIVDQLDQKRLSVSAKRSGTNYSNEKLRALRAEYAKLRAEYDHLAERERVLQDYLNR